ncbi:MAG: hypothetical protein QME52_09395 [Bacteroidota bacterium]|nr:hypothetical protein [Bacteroidota bacterium]
MKHFLLLTFTFLLCSSCTLAQEYTPDAYTVALYHFNETSGSIVYDSSGNGNNGTATGTVIVNGKFGLARRFNGISDRITIPGTSKLNVSPQLTLEAWIKPKGFTAGPNTFLRKNGPNSQNGYLMHFKNNGTVYDFGINTKRRVI